MWSPRISRSSASFSARRFSSRRDLRTLIAVSLFWVCDRSFWLWATMPVGQVGEPDRRVGLVDVLAAGALAAVRVDPDLVPVELDLRIVVVDLRHDLDEGERRLAAVLGVVRADPHEPVDAPFGAQPAVGPPAVDLDRHALEAGLLALELVDDLGLEPVALRPAQVHPQEHLGPVGRLGAAGAGADRDDRAPVVVLAREEERRSARAGRSCLELVRVAVELGGDLGVVGFGERSSSSTRSSARVSRMPDQSCDLGA